MEVPEQFSSTKSSNVPINHPAGVSPKLQLAGFLRASPWFSSIFDGKSLNKSTILRGTSIYRKPPYPHFMDGFC